VLKTVYKAALGLALAEKIEKKKYEKSGKKLKKKKKPRFESR